jgi:RimJ/RimL family protein N-acetyltransferase
VRNIPFSPIELELRGGRRVRIREIRPDDVDELRQAFGRLSSESRYTRFMSSIKELSPQMLDRAVHLQSARETGLVAETDAPDGIDIVGGARYFVLASGDDCEFAVTVVDGWQGVGLASRLMRELIQAARARGLKRMEGFVLAHNTAMIDLARRLGFTVATDPHDASVRIVHLDLTTDMTSHGRTPS